MPLSTPARVAFRRPWPGTVRGRVLWLCSLILGAKGLGYLIGDPFAIDAALAFLVRFAPAWLWGGLIVVNCLVAAFTAYCHHGRDRFGFDLLTGMSAAMATAHGLSMVFDGELFAVQGALSWLAVAVLLVWLRRLRDVRDEPLRGVQ